MKSIQTYRQILAKKGWYFCFNEMRKRIFRLHWLRSMNAIETVDEDRIYSYLKRKYGKKILNSPLPNLNSENPYPNKIWICWLQGMENAPQIVKRCYESVQKHSSGREIIVITDENIRQYVNFPEYIWKRRGKNGLSQTFLSDLLRISLLAQYGGIWIDASCFLTDAIPDYVANAPVFAFKTFLKAGKCKASNWFIAAQPANPIICQTRDMLYEYWRKERFLKHYFIFHLCFSIVCDSSERNKQMWKKVPVFPNANPHLLQFELFNEYNAERFEQIKHFSFIHKLSYKFTQEKFDQKRTIYDIEIKGIQESY
jgi:mannosyltransferase OCH1-like enzyme